MTALRIADAAIQALERATTAFINHEIGEDQTPSRFPVVRDHAGAVVLSMFDAQRAFVALVAPTILPDSAISAIADRIQHAYDKWLAGDLPQGDIDDAVLTGGDGLTLLSMRDIAFAAIALQQAAQDIEAKQIRAQRSDRAALPAETADVVAVGARTRAHAHVHA